MRSRTTTKLTPVRDIPAYAVILRAIHERGPAQVEAMLELERRQLWLTTDQRRQAGLSDHALWSKPDYPGAPVRMQQFTFGTPKAFDFGDVRIQHYGNDTYHVAVFLPGRSVCAEGDTPKTEPESSQWCETVDKANGWFDTFVSRAKRDGWHEWSRR